MRKPLLMTVVVMLCLSISSCSSFIPKAGMRFEEVNKMSINGFYGEMKHIRSEPPFEVYKTFESTYTDDAPPPVLKEYYFKNGVLVDDLYVNEQRKIFDEERREESAISEAKARADQERESIINAFLLRKEEECLSSSTVGLCLQRDTSRFIRRLIERDLSTYTLDDEWNRFFYQYNFLMTRLEVNRTTGLVVKMRNNNSYPIKDVVVSCRNIAESGTALYEHIETLYIVMAPHQIREEPIVVPDVKQQVRIECRVRSFEALSGVN